MGTTDLQKRIAFFALILLAVMRIIFYHSVKDRIDDTTLLIIGIAVLILIVPFEKITSFKAANVEFVLEKKEVQTSINAIGAGEVEQENLKTKLKLSEHNLKYLINSKILWIDDNQIKILGEKRLLRTLGVHIVPAMSSMLAKDILQNDSDFDLIITDIQRQGEYYKENNGIKIHDGVNFIEFMIANSLITEQTPIIFYAAYPYDSLIEFTERVRILKKGILSVNNVGDLVYEVINTIALRKNDKTNLGENKTPT